jgi:serine/threonine protein kinase
MGSGAYGVVMSVQYFLISGFASYFDRHRSAADEISGETVAIKLVTRIFDKIQLAKRALREITLLRHFANHENITGLIDVDAISPDFNEMFVQISVSIVHMHLFEARRYIFMEVSHISRCQQAFHSVELPGNSLWKVGKFQAGANVMTRSHLADLHQIIKSGQSLTNEHVQYFLYQILRG